MGLKVDAKQVAEWQTLKLAVVHRPSIEIAYGQLAPIENLYDDVIDLRNAQEEHDIFSNRLIKEGVKIYEIFDLIKDSPLLKEYVYKKLNELYAFSKYSLSPKWKTNLRSIVDSYPPDALLKLSMLRPRRINVSASIDKRKRESSIDVHVLANLIYMRDQQFVTDRGLVLGALKMPARQGETELTEIGLSSLGLTPIYRMNNPFEGGDFLPAGEIAFIGRGYRNTEESVKELLISGALGYKRVVVVRQPEQQETMHLDTYFNIINNNLVAIDSERADSSKCTLFELKNEKYIKTKSFGFGELLKQLGMQTIKLNLKKERFGTNFLTLKNNKILMPSGGNLNAVIKRYENAGVEVVPIDVKSLLAGYGGIHCMTAVLRRD